MKTIINCIETSIDEGKNIKSLFLIEPLETGQGITLGNSLRRTLLSDLNGFAITGARINNLKHEFSIVEGIREDVLEILLNLKDVVFKPSVLLREKVANKLDNLSLKYKAFLNVQGPVIVTAGMFFLPKDIFQIVNPEQYICTIMDTSNVYIEIDIENGIGYQLTDDHRKKDIPEKLSVLQPTTLLVDAVFMPVKKVNYKIKLIHDSQGNIKESLQLEITTNGSITPKRSLLEAGKILLTLFSSLLFTPELTAFSTTFEKKFEILKQKQEEEKKKDEKNDVKKDKNL